MAPQKKGSSGGKKAVAKKPAKKLYKLYEVSGDSAKLKTKLCPKCSSFMGKHANRFSCGKCKYTEKI